MITKEINLILGFLLVLLMCSGIVQAKPTEAELAVFKVKLDKKIKVKIKSEPLEDFFIRLRKTCKIPIVSSADVNLEMIIKISFDEISVKDAIYWVCKKYRLDYEVKRGALYFLDLDESLKKNAVLKSYNIKFLKQTFLRGNSFLANAITDGLIRENSSSIDGDYEGDEGDSSLYLGNQIGNIIRSKTPKGNWDSSETSIEISGDSLRVKNTPEIQKKVKALLKYYHEKYGLQVQSRITILSVPKKEFNEYILKDLKGSNILSVEEMKRFFTKKITLWQKKQELFTGTTVSYNFCLTNVSLREVRDSLIDFEVIDSDYDSYLESYWNDDGVSLIPVVSRDQSKIILSITGQYSPSFEIETPKDHKNNRTENIDKIQAEVAKFSTSLQIPNGGGALISIGSDALSGMKDQLIVFCISSKVNKKK